MTNSSTMWHCLYVDHSKEVLVYVNKVVSKQPPIIFSCYAENIMEADEKYKKHFNEDVSRQKHIGLICI